MFSERLGKAIDFVGASNRTIAKYANCDASLVSRLKSGSRTPKQGSSSVKKVADGIYLFCDDLNILPAFCSLFGGNAALSKETVTGAFIEWLYENHIDAPKENKKITEKAVPVPFENISPKLDIVMSLLGMSNIRLARETGVDRTYISRIRTGIRTPKSNSALLHSISDALSDRIWNQHLVSEVIKEMNISAELIQDREDLSRELYAWLCDAHPEGSLPTAEMLLDRIEAFSPDTAMPLPDITSLMEETSDECPSYYAGTDGLRSAVIRFLSDAVKNKEKELWLYSDQDMNWMVGDDSFKMKWLALMVQCAKCGIKIKIVHNIDRDITEMMAAINSWLPLYMCGNIEPYYCAQKNGGRFSHTIFLCPCKACISSFQITGYENNAYYDYITDSERLSFIADEYEGLLNMSKPLVKLHSGGSLPITEDADGHENTVIETLSLATMPKELLLSMLECAGIEGDGYKNAVTQWETVKAHFEKTLKKGYVHEFIPKIDDEDIWGDGAPSAIAGGINYTPSELSEHARNILSLMDRYSNYRVYFLPEMPFPNIRLIVDENRAVVTRLKAPQISFEFTHPFMRDAFDSYISGLKDICPTDKKSARGQLNSYL